MNQVKAILIAVAFFISSTAIYSQDLFISEYAEGSSNNKYIEIYNPTLSDVDLSSYSFKRSNNGAADWGDELVLSGTLASGDVYVIYNSSASQEIVDEGDSESTITFYNGDDAIGLFKNDVLIDAIGVLGVDPGSAWDVAGVDNATGEHTLVRKGTITEGNTDWASSAGTDVDDSEWIVYDRDTWDYVGKHKLQASDLFFSEYSEGSSNNKYYEIYNGTAATVDLSNYEVRLYNNGATSPNNTESLTGNILNGDVFVVTNSSLSSPASDESDINSNTTFFNGDDALALYKNGVLIDVVGTIGQDPGSSWSVADGSTANNTIVRKSVVTSGNTNWPTAAGTGADDSEWIAYSQNTWDYIGYHIEIIDFGPQPVTYWEDDFQDQTFEPWAEYSIQGNRDWGIADRSGDYYAQINGFGGDGPQEDYLISPAVDTRRYTEDKLEFENLMRYDGSTLQVYASTDYKGIGNPTDATWVELTDAFIDDNTSSWNFVNSGEVDISSYFAKEVFFAFRYTAIGGNSGESSTTRVDDFVVSGYEVTNVPPTKLAISKVDPYSPLEGVPFNLHVESLDDNNIPMPVESDVNFTLALLDGTGSLTGTLTGTISTGSWETIVEVNYNAAESIRISVSDDANGLATGNSRFIELLEGPDELEIQTAYSKGHVGAQHPTIVVVAKNADGSTNTNFDGFEVTLNVYASDNAPKKDNPTLNDDHLGPLVATYTSTSVMGVTTFENVEFNNPDNYTLIANGGGFESPEAPVDVIDYPDFTEVLVPKYMIGNAGDGNFGGRLPVYMMVELSGLHPNTEYRFYNQATEDDYSGDEEGLQTTTLYGNNIHYSEEDNSFWHVDATDLAWTEGNCDSQLGYRQREYSTFTSDGSGNKTLWVNLYTSSNYRFDVNEDETIYPVFVLGNEQGSQVRRYQFTNTLEPKVLGENPNNTSDEATGVYDMGSQLEPKSIVVLYSSNEARPLSSAIVQGDESFMQSIASTDIQTCTIEEWWPHQGASFYRDIDGYWETDDQFGGSGAPVQYYNEISGGWAAFIPNLITDQDTPSNTFTPSLNRIVVYDLKGNMLQEFTDGDGVWAGVNTNNVLGGQTAPINLETPDLQLTSFTGFSEYCNSGNDYITWDAHGVSRVNIYVEDASTLNREMIFEDIPAVNDPENMPGKGMVEWVLGRGEYNDRPLRLVIESVEHIDITDISSSDITIYDEPQFEFVSQSGVWCQTDTVQLSVLATGSALEYQWYKDGEMIDGETNMGLLLETLEFDDAGEYWCEVKNSASTVCGDYYSETIVVHVASQTDIVVQPETIGGFVGGTAMYHFEAQANGVPPTYRLDIQWYKGDDALEDNDRITGSRTNHLLIRDVQESDFNNEYYAVIIAQCGTVETAKVGLIDADITINSEPQSQAICQGTEINLTVDAVANDGGDLTYQWYRNGIMLSDNARITGSMTNTLVVQNADGAVDGTYVCEITVVSSGLVIRTTPAMIDITNEPSITNNLNPTVDVRIDEALNLTVAADSPFALTYQWYKDGEMITDATNPTFEISNVTETDAGDYYCEITNECGTVRSSTSTVTVNTSTVSSINEVNSNGFRLLVPSPNPVQSNSRLEFSLEKASELEIVLSDATGQEITTLTRQNYLAGTYGVTIDSESLGLSNGVYFATLRSNETSISVKFIVNK